MAGAAPKTFFAAGPETVNTAVAAADCFRKPRRDSVVIGTSLKSSYYFFLKYIKITKEPSITTAP
jgi:hypothetical protein